MIKLRKLTKSARVSKSNIDKFELNLLDKYYKEIYKLLNRNEVDIDDD